MARTGLTNFVVWALATVLAGLVFFAPSPIDGLLAAAVALGIAWTTRYWPEALGFAFGIAVLELLFGAQTTSPDSGAALASSAIVTAGVLASWRLRPALRAAKADQPESGPSTSSRARLSVASVLAAVVLLVVNFFLFLAFGFAHCAGDTTVPPPPGSDLANYCNLARDHTELAWLMVLGPSLVVLGFGLFTAYRRQARPVLITVLAGVVLTIAVHVPEYIFAG